MVHEFSHSFHQLNDGGSRALWFINTVLSHYMLYVLEGSSLIIAMRISNLTLLHYVCVCVHSYNYFNLQVDTAYPPIRQHI